MARALTAAEVNELLASDQTLADRVRTHESIVARFGWDQMAQLRNDNLPIPVRGLTVQTALGPVIIFADTSGTLHYTLAQSSEELSTAREVMKPSYESPDEGIVATLNDMISRAGDLVSNVVTLAMWGAGLYIAFQVYREFKS